MIDKETIYNILFHNKLFKKFKCAFSQYPNYLHRKGKTNTDEEICKHIINSIRRFNGDEYCRCDMFYSLPEISKDELIKVEITPVTINERNTSLNIRLRVNISCKKFCSNFYFRFPYALLKMNNYKIPATYEKYKELKDLILL